MGRPQSAQFPSIPSSRHCPIIAWCGFRESILTLPAVPDEPNDDPLQPELVSWRHDNWSHRRIGWVQLDPILLLVVALDRRFPIDAGDDRLTIPSGSLLVDDDDIPRKDAVVTHRFPFDTER